MRHSYKPQEKSYTCGPAAIRNCLIHFGVELTEETIRKVCDTRKDGTDETSIIEACEYYGFETKEIESKSTDVFRRKISKGLKAGKVYIASTDSHCHWISVLEYKNRKLKIIDSDFREEGKSILQYITFKEFVEMAFGYDKFDKTKTCYAIELKFTNE